MSILGRVVATERRPNTPHEFHFWTALDASVGIGTIVRVVGAYAVAGHVPVVYGVGAGGVGYPDPHFPVPDLSGHGGGLGGPSYASTVRTEIRLYTAAVLRQLPEEPL